MRAKRTKKFNVGEVIQKKRNFKDKSNLYTCQIMFRCRAQPGYKCQIGPIKNINLAGYCFLQRFFAAIMLKCTSTINVSISRRARSVGNDPFISRQKKCRLVRRHRAGVKSEYSLCFCCSLAKTYSYVRT